MYKKKVVIVILALVLFFTVQSMLTTAFAADNQIDTIKQKVINVILDISGPIGFIFTLGGVVLIALKLMVQHNNPNKRVETISGLPWLAGASIILGSAMLIANIIISLGQGK